MVRLLQHPKANSVVAHPCEFGLLARGKAGGPPQLAKKPTRFLSNSVAVLRQLDRTCSGCPKHVEVQGEQAARAAVHPKALCRAVCRGVRQQVELDASVQVAVSVAGDVSSVELNELWGAEQGDGRQFGDDVSGKTQRFHVPGLQGHEASMCLHRPPASLELIVTPLLARFRASVRRSTY